jgi:hypothetical protein
MTMRKIFRAWLDQEAADGADPRTTLAAIERRVAPRRARQWVVVAAACVALIVVGVVVRAMGTEVEAVEVFVGRGGQPVSEAMLIHIEVRRNRYAWNEAMDGVGRGVVVVAERGDRHWAGARDSARESRRILVEAGDRGVQANPYDRLLSGHRADREH